MWFDDIKWWLISSAKFHVHYRVPEMTYLPFINTLAYVPVLNGGGVVAVGQMLKDKGLTFDYAFTSVLSRAIKTLFYIQDTMGLHWVPVVRDYRLNERHYGSLQGLNKSETAAKHGEEQVKVIPFTVMSVDINCKKTTSDVLDCLFVLCALAQNKHRPTMLSWEQMLVHHRWRLSLYVVINAAHMIFLESWH